MATNGKSKIYGISSFEDSAGRMIDLMVQCDVVEEDEAEVKYRAKGFVNLPAPHIPGSYMKRPVVFCLDAESVEDAFEMYDDGLKQEMERLAGPKIATASRLLRPPQPPRKRR